jgi:hypothetical protein
MLFIIVVVLGAIITAFFMMGSDDGAEGTAGPAEGADEAQSGDSVQENPKQAAEEDAKGEEVVPDTEAVVEKAVDEKAPQSDPTASTPSSTSRNTPGRRKDAFSKARTTRSSPVSRVDTRAPRTERVLVTSRTGITRDKNDSSSTSTKSTCCARMVSVVRDSPISAH